MSRVLSVEAISCINQDIKLVGWVNSKRDHGQIAFIDLRDRAGLIQLVGDKEYFRLVTPESVVEVIGTVVNRTKETVNPEMETGDIEVKVKSVNLISKSSALPIPTDGNGLDIDEEARLKYRYLDLRRKRMQENIKLRSQTTTFIRNWLVERDFLEIETPILTKTTPEGARDFVVPSRLQPGKFYALPQSPQQFKQMLMVAGMERYFQFARCFRDEDARSDRAYGEFTQLDLEMSFVIQEDIIQLTEELFSRLVTELMPHKKISQSPWPRLSHKEAIHKYGTDKPDLRRDPKDPDELAFSWTIDFPLFTEQSSEDFFHGSGKAKFAPSHHMFTAPHPDDIPLLDSDPLAVRGLQHDLVLNGYEVGGGSIRIHQPEVQAKVFDLIGFTQEQKRQFEHMLTAFTFGVPPHGGIAPGLDRFLMAALGEPSVREVMAFPTATSGRTAVVDAPSQITDEQKAELNLNDRESSDLSAYEKIIQKLKNFGVDFTHYVHEPVYTSQDAMKVRGDVELSQGAKALVLQADKDLILFVLPGDKRADLKGLADKIGVKRVAMTSKETVLSKTGLEVGSIPPMGSVIELKTYVDSRLEQDEIVFNAAHLERSIRMKYSDFVKIEKPEIVDLG